MNDNKFYSKITQDILDASVEIRRAVWAGNLETIPEHCSFKNETELNQYINNCCKEAIKSLQQHLKKSENTLF